MDWTPLEITALLIGKLWRRFYSVIDTQSDSGGGRMEQEGLNA